MTTTPHPYAHILRAIADGHPVQRQSSSGKWHNQGPNGALDEISDAEYTPDRYRIAPRTITINGHEVPEPLRELPPAGATVYWPSFGRGSYSDDTEAADIPESKPWIGGLLEKGLLHLTREAASAHANALVSFTITK